MLARPNCILILLWPIKITMSLWTRPEEFGAPCWSKMLNIGRIFTYSMVLFLFKLIFLPLLAQPFNCFFVFFWSSNLVFFLVVCKFLYHLFNNTLFCFLFYSDLVLYGRPHIPNRILHQWSRGTTVQITQQHRGGLLLCTVRARHLLHNSRAPFCGKSLPSWLRGRPQRGQLGCSKWNGKKRHSSRRAHDGVVAYSNNSLNCKTKQTITARTTYECSPLPNLCFVKPLLSLLHLWVSTQRIGGRWSSHRQVRKGQSASRAAASSTTLLWNNVPLSSVQLRFAAFYTIVPPTFVEGINKKLVENAGTDIMDRALSATRGTPHVLSSGQRAGRDTPLLQKREKAKGNSIKNIISAHTLHEVNAPGLLVRTLQGCASLLHIQILTDASLNLTYQNKLPPELNLSSVQSQADVFVLLTLHLLISSCLISGFAEPFTCLVWFANVPYTCFLLYECNGHELGFREHCAV